MSEMQYHPKSIYGNFHSRKYQLIEPIGEGGFGHVYKAKQNINKSVGRY